MTIVVGDVVRRNPKFWKNDRSKFKVTAIHEGWCYIVRLADDGTIAREENVWTGVWEDGASVPYMESELVKEN